MGAAQQYGAVSIRILTEHMKGDFLLEASKFAAQYKRKIEIRTMSNYHDRFIVVDGKLCWHVGASIKDAGRKALLFSEVVREGLVQFIISDIDTQWLKASVVAT